MDALKEEFGYLKGDVPIHSPVNVGLDLRGQECLIDLTANPDLVEHIHKVVAQTYEVGRRIKARTGSISLSICRLTGGFKPDMVTIPNCNLQMISHDHYHRYLKNYDIWLGEQFGSMGIHHCGNNVHLFTQDYADLGDTTCLTFGRCSLPLRILDRNQAVHDKGSIDKEEIQQAG